MSDDIERRLGEIEANEPFHGDVPWLASALREKLAEIARLTDEIALEKRVHAENVRQMRMRIDALIGK